MRGFRGWLPIESTLFFIGLVMSWEPLWPFISGRQCLWFFPGSFWFRASVWQVSPSTSSWVLWPICWPGLIAPLWLIGDGVKDGSIIMRLLRLVHFSASYLFTELGSKWLIFISVGLPFLSVIILMKILSGQGIVEVLGLTILYLVSLTLAYLINFFFNICFGFTAFVFKNLWGSNLLKTSIVAFMSGSMIPLAFFPKVVSAILSLLPFSSLIYTPVMIIVGK